MKIVIYLCRIKVFAGGQLHSSRILSKNFSNISTWLFTACKSTFFFQKVYESPLYFADENIYLFNVNPRFWLTLQSQKHFCSKTKIHSPNSYFSRSFYGPQNVRRVVSANPRFVYLKLFSPWDVVACSAIWWRQQTDMTNAFVI